MDQLFLIEILVETIYFNTVGPVPQKKQINIVATFGNFASLEIRYDGIGGVEEGSKSTDVEFSTGKSYLFPSNADRLLEALSKCPLEILVGTKQGFDNIIGRTTVSWTADFIDMVKSCKDSVGYITPASIRDIFPMKDLDGNESGHIDIFLRLSCFGQNIQTQFQIVHAKDVKSGNPRTQFLFKSTNAATTFQCERYGMGTSTEVLPIAPVYNSVDIEDRGLKPVYRGESGHICQSVVPSAFDFGNRQTVNMDAVANELMRDQYSINIRPGDGEYMNLHDIDRSAQVSSSSKRVKDDDLTAENINKLLCKNHDCPAVQKFKEFGIGPLATGKGLGTLYGNIEPMVTYGLTHVHGSMDRYGPLGLYSRPKNIDEPFVPKHSYSSLNKSESGSLSTQSSKHSKCCCQNPLRLSGGAPMDENERPSALVACKELMEDFDKVLDAYKKALGPCGHTTCPFAPNVVAESCKKVCPGSDGSHIGRQSQDSSSMGEVCNKDTESVSTCGMSTCPYSRKMTMPVEEEFKLNQMRSACGESTCPYAKKRLGYDDDDTLEAACQLATMPKNCGSPQCPHEPEPELPPIHWDCPNPLPKGPCTNPKCPIEKHKNLAGDIFKTPQSPCNNSVCPYAIPPPCEFPGCPFGPPQPCTVPGCPFNEPSPCTDPKCPLSITNKSSESVCEDPNCPYSKSKDLSSGVCTDPACPYARSSSSSGGEGDICVTTTCKAKGGEITCAECGGIPEPSACPCTSQGDYKNDISGNDNTEVCAGDTLEPCTPYTCKTKGGSLECLECDGGPCPCTTTTVDKKPLPVDNKQSQPITTRDKKVKEPKKDMERETQSAPAIASQAPKKKTVQKETTSEKTITTSGPSKVKRKKRSKYVYDAGDNYPGVKIGHRECIVPQSNVPHNMGWLWNIKPSGRLRPRRGWKPGALTKSMAITIEKHRLASGIKPLIPSPTAVKPKKKKKKNAYGVYESDSDSEPVIPKPTLQIKKKDGCYLITMNPLKDPFSLEDNENPYMDCTPMQFKITKNKPPVPIKNYGEEEGEESSCCCCGDESESSESELDIEFTPPAGVIHPDKLKKKKNVVHADTQYCLDDIPKPANLQLGGGGKGKAKGGGKAAKGGKGKGKGKKK